MSGYDVARQRGGPAPAQISDVLERILDKGIVIAGDIKIDLLDIELLTIRLRLLVASADKAREMGIDWWAHDPELSSKARPEPPQLEHDGAQKQLMQRMDRLESKLAQLLDRTAPAKEQSGKQRRGRSGAAHGSGQR